MKTFLLSLIFPVMATYTYSVTLNNSQQALYIITNAIAALAWIVLGVMIHLARTHQAPLTLRFWVYPLTLSIKIFCGISAVRYLLNNIVIYYPTALPIQGWVYIINVMALAIAVGYVSVFYKRIPEFLQRLSVALDNKHDP